MPDFTNFRILTDAPSKDPSLGFSETANGLADLISNSAPRFAVAIFGPWGSGKTTLMNAINCRLEKDDRIIRVDFSAWRYEREEHLIIPLLDSIRGALVDWSDKMIDSEKKVTIEKGNREKFSKAALTTATTVGRVMASVLAGISIKAGLPGALSLSFDANKALAAASDERSRREGNGADSFAERLSDPTIPQSIYHACFRALTSAFEQFEKKTDGARFVIFVDDLDRCLPAGTIEVLESMKLFFDLKGFVFVVGLDREVVEQCIDSRYAVRDVNTQLDEKGSENLLQRVIHGSDYLKKIFQLPFSLAPVSVGMLDELFYSMQQGSYLPDEQMDDLRNTVRPHLEYLFSGMRLNPREVKRFINAYTIQMKVKPDLQEPDIVLALNTIAFRQDCRNLYDAIATYRIEFTSALRFYITEDTTALDDFDLSAADLPDDIRTYLSVDGPAHILLITNDIDGYIDAGEATRSSVGSKYLDLLSAFRDFRSSINHALDSDTSKLFDEIHSKAMRDYEMLENSLSYPSINKESYNMRMTEVQKWLDPTNERTSLDKFRRALKQPKTSDDIVKARESARIDAKQYFELLRMELRQYRRRVDLSETAYK